MRFTPPMLALLAVGLLLLVAGATVLADLVAGPGLVALGAGVVGGVVVRAHPSRSNPDRVT